MIIYNEAMDMEIMELLENCIMKNYTKMKGVFGKGTTSGIHMGTDIWPGRNNVLYVACEEDDAKQLISCAKKMREKSGKEGIKAFMWGIEDAT
jgi:hypothetical protein